MAALRQREQEVNNYYQQAAQAQRTLLEKEEENVQAKEREANDLYEKAVSSGDASLMSKADTLKSEVALQKEKVRLAKQKQEQIADTSLLKTLWHNLSNNHNNRKQYNQQKRP